MPLPNQPLTEQLIDALDVKQLKEVPKSAKQEFAKRIASRLSDRQKIIRDLPDSREYKSKLKETALAASEALQAYFNLRYKKAENVNIAAIQGLLLDKDIDRVTLNDTIKCLNHIGTYFGNQKPGTDSTPAYLLAKMVAKNYKEILGVKPTHNRNFQTWTYDGKTWDVKEKGSPSPFDTVCLVIHCAIGIKFSEPTLRNAIKIINQKTNENRDKLSRKRIS